MKINKIAIGSDHAGFELKEKIKIHLQLKGFEIVDFGPSSAERTDYPDYAHPVAKFITDDLSGNTFGVLICGSGNGINMTANKHQQIRSALCWMYEIAELARQHNNANIITLPARYITFEEAKKCVDIFFSTDFEGGRHTERVNKISCC
ncbi:MAG: ribose 5-phosphate isomerase B [Flavobacteriales bacterium]|nr:ribose 5-phosphate isomerase B [Flavobacteriales bacterium]